MTAQDRLIRLFNKIDAAHIMAGKRDSNIAEFVDNLRSGDFFRWPEKNQMDALSWHEKAYLGRGDILVGMVHKKLLSEDIYAEMRLAIMMYYLTLESVDDEAKDWLRKRVADILNK